MQLENTQNLRVKHFVVQLIHKNAIQKYFPNYGIATFFIFLSVWLLANKIIFSAEVVIRIIQDVLKTIHVYVAIYCNIQWIHIHKFKRHNLTPTVSQSLSDSGAFLMLLFGGNFELF